jgi:hypothetical protein
MRCRDELFTFRLERLRSKDQADVDNAQAHLGPWSSRQDPNKIIAFSVYQYPQACKRDHSHGKNGSMSCQTRPGDCLAIAVFRHSI